MTADTRNVKVAVALIAAMTLGAVVLLMLEPPRVRWSGSALLAAEHAPRVEAIEIEYVQKMTSDDLDRYDCVIFARNSPLWRPRGARIRLALVGAEDAGLRSRQAESLLAVLGSLTQSGGLDLANVRLASHSDPRQAPDLPQGAHELCDLLLRKGIIR